MIMPKDDKIYQLTTQLRALGVAVCVFQSGDVISAHCGDKPHTKKRVTAASDWLLDNRKYLEESMTSGGWNYINFASDPIS